MRLEPDESVAAFGAFMREIIDPTIRTNRRTRGHTQVTGPSGVTDPARSDATRAKPSLPRHFPVTLA